MSPPKNKFWICDRTTYVIYSALLLLVEINVYMCAFSIFFKVEHLNLNEYMIYLHKFKLLTIHFGFCDY